MVSFDNLRHTAVIITNVRAIGLTTAEEADRPSGRLRLLASQRLCFALKTPSSDGTSHLLLSPMDLLEKLAALVPPPLISYATTVFWSHGTAPPAASCRQSRLPSRRRCVPSTLPQAPD